MGKPTKTAAKASASKSAPAAEGDGAQDAPATMVANYRHTGLEVVTKQTPNGPVRIDPGDFVCDMSDGSTRAVKPAEFARFSREFAATVE